MNGAKIFPLYFVGPLPPPTGGVAVMNMNVQRLMQNDYVIHSFNTASGSIREDLYGKKGIRELVIMLKMLIEYLKFIMNGEKTVINIFITSGLSFVRDIFFIFFAKLFRYKIVLHMHAKCGGEIFVEGFLINIFNLVIDMADVVLVLSEQHKKFFSQHIDASKIQVLNNFVFTTDFQPTDKRKKMDFLYVGRLTEQKGFYDLLDALTEIKAIRCDFVVHIIGVAETKEREAFIIEEMRKRNLNDILRLHGVLQGVEKYNLFRSCAVLIFPSHLENSPVVLKEGLMAKQAIIYSEIEENKAIIAARDLTFGYKCGDTMALQNTILYVVNNQEKILREQESLSLPIEFSDIAALDAMKNVITLAIG
jgi:glycosyltransferase involved in cell wall biosynthesis